MSPTNLNEVQQRFLQSLRRVVQLKTLHKITLAASVAGLLVGAGCQGAVTQSTTAEFGLSGIASLGGVVLDGTGAPLDSFRVAVGVVGGDALYRSEQVVTKPDGRFTLRIERRGASATIDSIMATVSASSLRV